MGTVKFTHTVAQIDASVDAADSLAQRFGVDAIVPCTQAQYDALETKQENTLYIVYSGTKFTIYYGTRTLSGGGSAVTAGRAVGIVRGVVSTRAGEPIY